MCSTCYQAARARGDRVFNRIGVIGLGERPPARITGVEQRAVAHQGARRSRATRC